MSSDGDIPDPGGGTQPEPHAGDSAEQRRAEVLMLDVFEQQLQVALQRPLIIPASATARMQFDAGLLPEDAPGILIEAWAHQGPPRAGS